MSRIEGRIKFPQNQRCRAKIALHPPKSRCRTFLRTPLSHFPLIRSRQGARRAGGGYRGTFGFRKRIALQGGVAATVTPVALNCATKRAKFRSPHLGSAEGGHPDLFRFPRFLPICSDLRSLFSGILRFVPICSDLLRFLPICSDLFSEQTNKGNPFSADPFCKSPKKSLLN